MAQLNRYHGMSMETAWQRKVRAQKAHTGGQSLTRDNCRLLCQSQLSLIVGVILSAKWQRDALHFQQTKKSGDGRRFPRDSRKNGLRHQCAWQGMVARDDILVGQNNHFCGRGACSLRRAAKTSYWCCVPRHLAHAVSRDIP
jgi:hypothetical protein